jgi:hypothetical protein
MIKHFIYALQHHQKTCTSMITKVIYKFIVSVVIGCVCDDSAATARSSYQHHEAAICRLVERIAELKNEMQHTKTVAEQQSSIPVAAAM